MAANAESAWPPGPARPQLAQGAVHVWRADLDTLGQAPRALLQDDERARADRLVSAQDRRRWATARGVLRALLGRYLDSDPAALRFTEGPQGKPSLQPPSLSFNLSHSAGLALYAITASASLGIDIEVSRHPVDVLGIAARMFGSREAERLQALDPAERQPEFLRAWVRYEADLKRLGLGIAAQPPDDDPAAWILDLDAGAGAPAALAVDHRPSELCCWTWSAAPA